MFPCTDTVHGSVLLGLAVFNAIAGFAQTEPIMNRDKLLYANDASGTVHILKERPNGKKSLVAVVAIVEVKDENEGESNNGEIQLQPCD